MNVMLLLLTTLFLTGSEEELVTVHLVVAADTSEHADTINSPEATLNDLESFLKERKKTLTLVDDPLQATVTVEVLGRGFIRFQAEDLGPYILKKTAGTDRAIFMRVKVEDHSSELIGTAKDAKFWRMVAERAADQVEGWIKANQETLLEVQLNKK